MVAWVGASVGTYVVGNVEEVATEVASWWVAAGATADVACCCAGVVLTPEVLYLLPALP